MISMKTFREIIQKYLPEDQRNFMSEAEGVTLLKRHTLSIHGLRLTNMTSSHRPISIGPLNVSFIYKRYLLQIENPEQMLPFFGPTKKGKRKFSPYLLNSGQASIQTVLSYLRFHHSRKTIECLNHVYIGAREWGDIIGVEFLPSAKVKPKNKVDTLWICSSYFEKNLLSQLSRRDYAHVVIDTSCWALNSPVLQMLLKKFSQSSLYLIRSVSKLDMGGIEYGSLGSLLVNEGAKELEKMMALTGAFPSLEDIPPYLFDDDFLELSNRRTRDLEKIVEAVEKKIDLKAYPGIEVFFPEHKKYFFVRFAGILPETLIPKLEAILRKLMVLFQIPGGLFHSFGFEEVAYSFYPDQERTVLRLSPGQGKDRDKQVIQLLDAFLQTIKKRKLISPEDGL